MVPRRAKRCDARLGELGEMVDDAHSSTTATASASEMASAVFWSRDSCKLVEAVERRSGRMMTDLRSSRWRTGCASPGRACGNSCVSCSSSSAISAEDLLLLLLLQPRDSCEPVTEMPGAEDERTAEVAEETATTVTVVSMVSGGPSSIEPLSEDAGLDDELELMLLESEADLVAAALSMKDLSCCWWTQRERCRTMLRTCSSPPSVLTLEPVPVVLGMRRGSRVPLNSTSALFSSISSAVIDTAGSASRSRERGLRRGDRFGFEGTVASTLWLKGTLSNCCCCSLLPSVADMDSTERKRCSSRDVVRSRSRGAPVDVLETRYHGSETVARFMRAFLFRLPPSVWRARSAESDKLGALHCELLGSVC